MGDRYAPGWDLLVNGSPIPPADRKLITSISVDASTDGADELRIVASAWSNGGYRLAGETLFAPGNSVVVRMGYGRELRTLQRFRMLREEPDFPDGDLPTVSFIGYSGEQRLVEVTQARKYTSTVPDSAIAQELAAGVGLITTQASVEPTMPRSRARVKPKGTTDWTFLQQLAVANDYGAPIVRFDEALSADVLQFRTSSLRAQRDYVRFEHRPAVTSRNDSGTLLSFRPRLSLAGVPTSVRVTGWDAEKQRPIAVEVALTGTGTQTTIYQGGEVRERAPDPNASQLYVRVLETAGDPGERSKVEAVPVSTVDTAESAVAFAERWIQQRNRSYTTARAKVIGYEGLWVGQFHEFTGLPSFYEGLYEIMRVRHRQDSGGYYCDLDLDRVILEAGLQRV